MRKLLFIILIFTFNNLIAQQIESGTIFTIEFTDPNSTLLYEIVSEQNFNGTIELSKMDSLVNTNPNEDQIIGIFAKGKFGNKTNSMLVLKSGLEQNVNYYLKILPKGKRKFQNTSTSSLFTGVQSIEYWPYPIQKIEFKGFEIVPNDPMTELNLEPEIDSTCIKNSDFNIEKGQNDFISHINSVSTYFTSDDSFKLNKMLDYEKTNNYQDVSLGHKWTLGEGIYPNEMNFKFGKPISYRRIECPIFEGKVNYFYTEDSNEIKVVSYNWNSLEQPSFGNNVNREKEIKKEFEDKYDFVVNEVSKILGSPLNLEQKKDSGRIDTKWKSPDGIKAYLFRFKNYNEINLYIYKD